MKKKIDMAIKLLKQAERAYGTLELSYSGGKDSDVILALAQMAGIKYKAVYKCTTIDPPGTISHCLRNGVEIIRPKRTFFDIIKQKGFPSRFARFCCQELKEYKIEDTTILGIRREESPKRAIQYNEPIQCRIYGKKDHVNQVLPILEWSIEEVKTFIEMGHLQLAPYYYRPDGSIDFARRLGCLGCPLATDNGLHDFVQYPKLVRAWCNAGKIWRETHPNIKQCKTFTDIYEYFAYSVFYSKSKLGYMVRNQTSLFRNDWKNILEDYFQIEL